MKDRANKKQNNWVSWFTLLNKSKRQTLDELRAFLIDKGLSDGLRATDKAYRLGFVRHRDGKERWNRRKYIAMMQSEKKQRKTEERGGTVHPMTRRRALSE